jgi:hypothetical protein
MNHRYYSRKYKVTKFFSIRSESGGTLFSREHGLQSNHGKTFSYVNFNEGDELEYNVQSGSLGDLYDIHNVTTGEYAKCWDDNPDWYNYLSGGEYGWTDSKPIRYNGPIGYGLRHKNGGWYTGERTAKGYDALTTKKDKIKIYEFASQAEDDVQNLHKKTGWSIQPLR